MAPKPGNDGFIDLDDLDREAEQREGNSAGTGVAPLATVQPEEEPEWFSPKSKSGTILRSMADAGAFGFSDELAGVGAGIAGMVSGDEQPGESAFDRAMRYAKVGSERAKAEKEQSEKENPWLYNIVNFGAGVAMPVPFAKQLGMVLSRAPVLNRVMFKASQLGDDALAAVTKAVRETAEAVMRRGEALTPEVLEKVATEAAEAYSKKGADAVIDTTARAAEQAAAESAAKGLPAPGLPAPGLPRGRGNAIKPSSGEVLVTPPPKTPAALPPPRARGKAVSPSGGEAIVTPPKAPSDIVPSPRTGRPVSPSSGETLVTPPPGSTSAIERVAGNEASDLAVGGSTGLEKSQRGYFGYNPATDEVNWVAGQLPAGAVEAATTKALDRLAGGTRLGDIVAGQAIAGGLYGAGSGDGLQDRLERAGTGAALGATGGTALALTGGKLLERGLEKGAEKFPNVANWIAGRSKQSVLRNLMDEKALADNSIETQQEIIDDAIKMGVLDGEGGVSLPAIRDRLLQLRKKAADTMEQGIKSADNVFLGGNAQQVRAKRAAAANAKDMAPIDEVLPKGAPEIGVNVENVASRLRTEVSPAIEKDPMLRGLRSKVDTLIGDWENLNREGTTLDELIRFKSTAADEVKNWGKDSKAAENVLKLVQNTIDDIVEGKVAQIYGQEGLNIYRQAKREHRVAKVLGASVERLMNRDTASGAGMLDAENLVDVAGNLGLASYMMSTGHPWAGAMVGARGVYKGGRQLINNRTANLKMAQLSNKGAGLLEGAGLRLPESITSKVDRIRAMSPGGTNATRSVPYMTGQMYVRGELNDDSDRPLPTDRNGRIRAAVLTNPAAFGPAGDRLRQAIRLDERQGTSYNANFVSTLMDEMSRGNAQLGDDDYISSVLLEYKR